MPYIPKGRRPLVEAEGPETGADLAYLLYKQVADYLAMRNDDLHYPDYADVLAAIEGTKMEYLRHHMWPYEDRKLDENGDVT